MKLIKRKITLSLFFILSVLSPTFAQNDNLLTPISRIENNNSSKPISNYFNLANIVDSFLTNETKQTESIADEKSKIRKEFI